MTLDLDGLEREAFERGRKEGLAERTVLQRRIKNQRRELKRLNTACRGLEMLARNAFSRETNAKINAYRHAAVMAESFHYWPFGRRIGAYIRRWC